MRLDAFTFQRISHKLYRRKVPVIPVCIDLFNLLFWKVRISRKTKIGRGTFSAYYMPGIVIHDRAFIGRNVEIHGGVVIGGLKRNVKGVPRIGSNVKIYSGAKILGDITIGDNAIIQANAVVIRNVACNEIVKTTTH